jgi:metal transporter CNNM
MDYFIVFVLLFLSGVFSGLTIGMFSLGLTTLERKIKLGDKRAVKIYNIRKNGSLLLVTLLLGNVAVNSAMAIFLGSIAAGFVAGLLATGLIVIFGEILPQAFFSRYALSFGAKFVWIVKFFIILFYPVSKPLSMLLDYVLGKEMPAIWSKQEIQEIIKHHEDSPDSSIDEDEERIILGALTFSDKTAVDIMTPKTVVYFLNDQKIIGQELLDEIREKGFSRIPVYNQKTDDMTGILYSKDLIGINTEKEIKVADLVKDNEVVSVESNTKLDFLFNLLIKKRVHMAFIFNEFGVFYGIVTLEDIIEEILKIEIVDEDDKIDDMQLFAKQRFKKYIIHRGS